MANPEFNSRGGAYDRQTEVFFGQMYRELTSRTLVGSLSKRNDIVAAQTAFESPSFDNSTFIWSETITQGDEKRITLSELHGGNPTYGDIPTGAGDFTEFKSQNFRLNAIKAPPVQIQGKESQKLVMKSITNIPTIARNNILDYHAQEENYDFIRALLYGGDKGLMKSASEGGKALSLGPGSGIGASTPLMGMHWYTTDTGFAAYDASDLSGWNTIVNNAINGIDAADADKVTQPQLEKIREKLDELNFLPGTLNGKRYKAIGLCDPQVMLRIANIYKDDFKNAMQRGKDNPIFNVNYQFEQDDILYISVPDLKKFRPDYNSSTGYIDIGPGIGNTDPRSYTTTSTNGLIVYIGAGAILRGIDGKVALHTATSPYGSVDGMSITAHVRRGFKRNQWDTYDGRTESLCYSILTAAFYEPGIDWS